jgi:hypothetical protein
MQYKGIEYETKKRPGSDWVWVAKCPDIKQGTSVNRVKAVLAAIKAIDRCLRPKRVTSSEHQPA